MVTTASLSSSALRERREVSILYLYLLRAVYLLIGIGMGIQVWPGIFHHDHVELMRSVTRSMLAGMTLLMFVGVRYPLQMLPLLFFEFAWKAIWLLSFAVPLYLGNQLGPDELASVQACLIGVIVVPIAIPWKYAFNHYILRHGDRWKYLPVEVAARQGVVDHHADGNAEKERARDEDVDQVWR